MLNAALFLYSNLCTYTNTQIQNQKFKYTNRDGWWYSATMFRRYSSTNKEWYSVAYWCTPKTAQCAVHFNQSYLASCNGELHQVKCALIISQDCCKKGEYFIQPLLVVNRENLAKTNKVWRKSICNQIQMELSRLRFKVKTPPIILLWVEKLWQSKVHEMFEQIKPSLL